MSGLGTIENENINSDIRSIKTNELLRINSRDDKGYAMLKIATRAYLIAGEQIITEDGGVEAPRLTKDQKLTFIAAMISLFALQTLFLSVETIIPLYI